MSTSIQDREPVSLTRQELAQTWRLSYKTVINHAQNGDGPRPFRVGRQWRYRLQDIVEHERAVVMLVAERSA